jgi:hypothetical protein
MYLTLGHWGLQAALDISNIGTLKVKALSRRNKEKTAAKWFLNSGMCIMYAE